MSVPDQPTIFSYTGNGVATTFAYGFYLLTVDDLTVVIDGVVQTTGFSVTGVGNQSGGSVIFSAAPADEADIKILREVAVERDTDYQPNGDLRSDTLNRDFDRLWMAQQDSRRDKTSSIRYPIFENLDGELPGKGSRANQLLGFDALGQHTMLPLPASVGAGDMVVDTFVAGVDFVSGVTTQLTLSRPPGVAANLEIFFDALFQGPDQWSVNAQVVTFTGAIPAGVGKVFARIGTTLSVGIPPAGSVGDAQIQTGSKLYNRMQDLPSVKDYGAIGDGSSDDYAAFAEAILENDYVFVPEGTYNLSQTLTLKYNSKLIGAGRDTTNLKQTTNNIPVITIPQGVNNFLVANLSLDRSVTPNSAGHGIYSPQQIGESVISNLCIRRQFDGLHLAAIDYGRIDNLIVERNYGDGIRLTTVHMAASAALQWYITNTICQLNAGHGFIVTDDKTGASVGSLVNCSTFANTGYGFAAQGTGGGGKIHSVRLYNCFFGSDAEGEIFLDTYSTLHEVADTYTEAPGIGPTGPAYSTPQTLIANCVDITANNNFVKIDSCDFIQPAWNGIVASCPNVKISDCRIIECGIAGSPGNRNGIVNNQTGAMLISNCQIGNIGANTFQQYGISTIGDDMIIMGNDIRNNATAAILGATTNAIVQGNFPTSVNH